MSDEKVHTAWDKIQALGGTCIWGSDCCFAYFYDTDLENESLAVFRDFPCIEDIMLSGNRRLTDECLEYLQDLPSLKSLTLYQTSITEAAANQFRQKHPSVNVISQPPTGPVRNPFTGEILEFDQEKDGCK